MRVLLITHAPRDPATAVWISVGERARALAAAGHSAEVWTPEDFPAPVRRAGRLLPFVFPPAVAARLVRRRRAFDAVVAHSWAGWAIRRGAGDRSPALIIEFHGLEPLYHRALELEAAERGRTLSRRYRLVYGRLVPALLARACRRSDRVFCLNRAERDHLVQLSWAPPERIEIQPAGVAAEFFAVDRPARPAAPLTRLAFLGQWLPAKGTAALAEAFARIAAARPEATLALLGTRTPEDRVRADFPPAVQAALRVRPTLTRDEVVAELAAADVFLFPSRSEGASLALLEAMAAGLAVVATPVGAAADLLVDGASALVVAPGDAPALAAAALRLLADPGLAARLGQGARATAAPHAWQQVGRRFAASLAAAVAESPHRRPGGGR